MLRGGERLLAAVSGGADSMCMLHLLWRMSRRGEFSLCVATFDHQIRPEGASDAAFVEDWCRKRGIVCVSGSENVPAYAKANRLGLEEGARYLRYAFLRKTAEVLHCSRIATAHNANDNAETVLLHLLRGTGLKGLGGISPINGAVIRPVLCCTRQEIEEYVSEVELSFVEDATNADTAYRRNYLRHEVLPLLTANNPSLLGGLLRSGESLRQDEAYLSTQAKSIAEQAVFTEASVTYSAKELAELPEALFSRVIQLWTERLSPETVLSSRSRKDIRTLCVSPNPSGRLVLPKGLTAGRVYESFCLERRREQEALESVVLSVGERVRFGGREFSCQWAVCPSGRFNQPHTYYLTPSERPILLRKRQTGDEITLPSRSRKSLKKLFIDEKIPREHRDSVAVLEIGGAVAAVDGFGTDIHFLPSENDKCWIIQSK